MMTSSNGNIFRVTGHLCGEFTCHREILRTKASKARFILQSPTVADSRAARRQSSTIARVFILQLATVASASGRLSSAVADCSFQSSTNSIQSPAVAGTFHPISGPQQHLIRSRPMQTWRTLVIKHLKLQIRVCFRRFDYKSHRKKNSWKHFGEKIERAGKQWPNSTYSLPRHIYI